MPDRQLTFPTTKTNTLLGGLILDWIKSIPKLVGFRENTLAAHGLAMIDMLRHGMVGNIAGQTYLSPARFAHPVASPYIPRQVLSRSQTR